MIAIRKVTGGDISSTIEASKLGYLSSRYFIFLACPSPKSLSSSQFLHVL